MWDLPVIGLIILFCIQSDADIPMATDIPDSN